MKTKEFVEKCFANFENIPEEFKKKLVEDLDKVMKKSELDYKRRIVAKLLERERMVTKEKLAK